ncbi:MAG: formate dehydrogenase, partial [Planctomycetes bacterium]|nr:formate dehydrogenase [Planctomycetota bacterium]
VWEEDEFWIELSWRIDPDGRRGIRKHFESPKDPSRPVSLDEYYGHIFDSIPSLVRAAGAEGLTPLAFMKRHGSFEVSQKNYHKHRTPLSPEQLEGSSVDEQGRIVKAGHVIGVMEGEQAVVGFPTPSKKLEFWSKSMKEHGWADQALPGFIKSHVHPDNIDRDKGEFCLVPTFRLPTLIHSRTGAAKWLNEISNTNPLWMHPEDMRRLKIKNGTIVRVNTEIGYFVDRVWATEAIKPGTAACSHHIGRWRRKQDPGNSRWSGSVVDIEKIGPSTWRTRKISGVTPFKSDDPDSERIFWKDGGVHQNAAAPIHPDPISGANCWLQKVRIEPAHAEDRYGDVVADTDKAHAVYQEWKAMCRPVKDGALRRIDWLPRPLAPVKSSWIKGQARGE